MRAVGEGFVWKIRMLACTAWCTGNTPHLDLLAGAHGKQKILIPLQCFTMLSVCPHQLRWHHQLWNVMKQSVFYFQQDGLSYRKNYSISSQRKHLENKWKTSDILTWCLAWTPAWIGWKGCAFWKQCIREDKIIWRNVIWDFNVEVKALPQSSVSFLEMFSMTWKEKQSCPQRSWKAKGNIFLMKRAVLSYIFLHWPDFMWTNTEYQIAKGASQKGFIWCEIFASSVKTKSCKC